MDANYRNKKNRQLWATIRQYGDAIGDRDLAEELVRNHAQRRFGAEHISALTGAQLLLLTEEVEAMMTGQPVAPAHPEPVEGRVEGCGQSAPSPQQLNTIRGMYAALGWDERRQAAYNQRIIHADAPATRREASSLIRAIQAMFLFHLDLPRLQAQIDLCLANWQRLDAYKRRIVTDAAQKITRGKSALTMGLVCKIQEIAAALSPVRARDVSAGRNPAKGDA